MDELSKRNDGDRGLSERALALRAARRAVGLTQEQAAAALGISRAHLACLENDFNTTSEDRLAEMLAGYDRLALGGAS